LATTALPRVDLPPGSRALVVGPLSGLEALTSNQLKALTDSIAELEADDLLITFCEGSNPPPRTNLPAFISNTDFKLVVLSSAENPEIDLVHHAAGKTQALRLRCPPDIAEQDRIWRGLLLSRLASSAPYLRDATELDPDVPITRYLITRTVAKRIRTSLKWLLVLLLAVTVIRLPFFLALPLITRIRHVSLSFESSIVIITAILDLALIVAVSLLTARGIIKALDSPLETTFGTKDPNLTERLALDELLSLGYGGLIILGGKAELTRAAGGIFACSGNSGKAVSSLRLRIPFLNTYRRVQIGHWLEIESAAVLRIQLKFQLVPEVSRWLRPLLLKPRTETLARVPDGPSWPREVKQAPRSATTSRRIVSVSTLMIGFVEIASALAPPLMQRIHRFHPAFQMVDLIPHRYADAVSAALGVALLALALGLRQGQHRSHQISLLIISVAIVSNLLRGINPVATSLLAIDLAVLLATRRSFDQKSAQARRLALLGRAFLAALGLEAVAVVVATAFHFAFRSARPFSIWQATTEIAANIIGISARPPAPFARGELQDALTLSGLLILILIIWALFAPFQERVRLEMSSITTSDSPEEIVRRWGNDTLGYFALRDDKVRMIRHQSLIAFGEFGSTIIVSPDPIGPPMRARQAMTEFLAEMNRKGKAVAVLGASPEWVEEYRKHSMRAYYIGDEALLKLAPIDLAGKQRKSLRQAVNRMKKYGYTVDFVNPLNLPDRDKQEVLRIMVESRRGERERGFSMTLGRVFDPRDTDLLMSICRDANGTLVGFCQWVPAPAIKGYSLDIMRRDRGEHPNGMFDLLIVETVNHLYSKGYEVLSLNFAAMRAVLSGDRGDGIGTKMEKWVLERLSNSMQIESLWRFNAKFEPQWLPRYLVVDTVENLASVAIASAKAESLWELPLIGKFLGKRSEQARK
jgi:lysylphosphatidylglycerol synthetase-like protein (DUF2156 family)